LGFTFDFDVTEFDFDVTEFHGLCAAAGAAKLLLGQFDAFRADQVIRFGSGRRVRLAGRHVCLLQLKMHGLTLPAATGPEGGAPGAMASRLGFTRRTIFLARNTQAVSGAILDKRAELGTSAGLNSAQLQARDITRPYAFVGGIGP
jgi:hypothetical protein